MSHRDRSGRRRGIDRGSGDECQPVIIASPSAPVIKYGGRDKHISVVLLFKRGGRSEGFSSSLLSVNCQKRPTREKEARREGGNAAFVFVRRVIEDPMA